MYFAENMTPQPGKFYAINKKGSDTVVTVVDGTSVAMRYWEGLATQKWECVENDGWLGFVSRASTEHDRGTYLGRDGNESLICSIPFHHAWEHFQVVSHEEGFALEMRKDDGLAFVGIAAGGTGLKLLPKGTTWWGFTVLEGATAGPQPSHAPSMRSLSIDVPEMKLVLHW